ncbi:MAG: NAD(P)(+) transhydrogenase (Re/Si-specific) subunit alpha, partial [Gammaproteobacteria bacterium]|nr:NAD(P)(+) transhydrogenase (Re/Si-specific) subunit alpha [Gammaproteobacteria bacterium]NIQ27095.1 NAD(P)(+) transhydrogenase (Re/Si-specific) subunit alpha [Gammaproteobacteria bacterium]
ASFSDDAYREAGCTIADSVDDVWSGSDIILQVRPPEGDRADGLGDSQTLISFLYPGQNPELLDRLTKSGGTALAMDSVPRISRA